MQDNPGMSEEKAKSKICPVRCGWDSTNAVDIELTAYCIASDCACWVWNISPNLARHNSALGADFQNVATGHCGLTR